MELPTIEQVAAQINATKTEAPAPKAESAPAEVPPVKEEAPVVETAPQEEPKAEAEPKKDPDSRKFAALAKREKELRQQQMKLDQQQREWEQRQKDFDSKYQQLQEREQNIVKGKRPLDVLKAAGFSYEQATQDVLGGYKPAEPDPVDQKLEPIQQKLSKLDELEQKLTQWEQKLTQREQESQYRVMMDSIKETVNKNAEKFEIISTMGDEGIDLVKDVMVEFYNEYGRLLSYDEACEQVEEYYEQELLNKLSATKKVQQRFKPAAEPPKPQVKAPAKTEESPKTLTADMTSGGEATVDPDKMSRSEFIEYYSKKLKFK